MELKPGYKQTEVGVIPEDWDCVSIRSAASNAPNAIVGGPFGSDLTSADYVYSGVPVIRGTNMGPKMINGPFVFVSTSKAAALSANLARPREIVFTQRGTLGQVSLVPEKPFDSYLVSQSQMKISIDCNRYSHEYIYHYFTSAPGQKQILDSAIQTGVPHTNLGICKKYIFPAPTLAEQETISEIFNDIDFYVEAIQRLVDKKKEIKQAAMQELLTGKRRLPGFQGEWEVKRLGEISTISMGRTPSRTNQEYWGSGHTWLSIADLKSKIVTESKEEITDSAALTMSIIPKGTLLMSFKLSIGKLCFAGRNLFTNEAICGFNTLDASSEFLYYVLSSTDFSLYGKQAVKGYTLNKESLQSVEVRLPGRDEQEAIASVLSSIDEEIVVLKELRDKALSMKQGMMQQLLTGKIRLR